MDSLLKAENGEVLHPSTNAQAVAEIVAKLHEPKELRFADMADGNGLALAVPKGINVISAKKFIDEFREHPERREGTARLGDLESFIAHANRFKDAGSAIFASDNPRQPSLTSVLDYHEATGGDPRFGKHRGHYAFPLSEEWRRWTNAPPKMKQAQFAEFVEENIINVLDPAAAKEPALDFSRTIGADFASAQRLMELSRGLKVRVSSHVQNAVTLATGETQFVYASEHQGESGQPLKVPGALLLALRVFEGGAYYQVPARLKYRVDGAEVLWTIVLARTDVIFEDAFNEAKERVRVETALPLFVGTPEA